MKRNVKALTENLVMEIRAESRTWTCSERERYFSESVRESFHYVQCSIELVEEPTIVGRYTHYLIPTIVECIRIARTYYNLTAEEIVQALSAACEVLDKE